MNETQPKTETARAENGPDVTALTNRLAMCPSDFLREPRPADPKKSEPDGGHFVHTGAVVSDLLHDLGGDLLDEAGAAEFHWAKAKISRNHAQLILVAAHLLHDDFFVLAKNAAWAEKARVWLTQGLAGLADIMDAGAFVRDAERREELVRLALAALDLLPAGETENAARDRLSTLDSIERERVIAESRQAQIRAQKLREELERKRAQEAASKMMRE